MREFQRPEVSTVAPPFPSANGAVSRRAVSISPASAQPRAPPISLPSSESYLCTNIDAILITP